jgi:hypothetical protein
MGFQNSKPKEEQEEHRKEEKTFSFPPRLKTKMKSFYFVSIVS